MKLFILFFIISFNAWSQEFVHEIRLEKTPKIKGDIVSASLIMSAPITIKNKLINLNDELVLTLSKDCFVQNECKVKIIVLTSTIRKRYAFAAEEKIHLFNIDSNPINIQDFSPKEKLHFFEIAAESSQSYLWYIIALLLVLTIFILTFFKFRRKKVKVPKVRLNENVSESINVIFQHKGKILEGLIPGDEKYKSFSKLIELNYKKELSEKDKDLYQSLKTIAEEKINSD
jgi:hypothetical protein